LYVGTMRCFVFVILAPLFNGVVAQAFDTRCFLRSYRSALRKLPFVNVKYAAYVFIILQLPDYGYNK
jgi:hypothetical protein